jgi:hypothetical protein
MDRNMQAAYAAAVQDYEMRLGWSLTQIEKLDLRTHWPLPPLGGVQAKLGKRTFALAFARNSSGRYR